MNAIVPQQLFDKIAALPAERIAEIALFVDFVTAREHDDEWRQAMMKMSELAFAAVWDNDENAIYDAA